MADVAIGRLRVRGPPETAARTAFLIEDGCRTALPDSEKLILVRRLDLGRSPGRRFEQAALLRQAYDRALLDSRHGASDSAAGANCVWFESRAEARLLLLAALLAGKSPSAWYWRLAVPEWRGHTADQWLEALAAPALRGDARPDLVEIVTLAVEAKAVDRLVRALAGPGALATATAPVPKVAERLCGETGAGPAITAATQSAGEAEIGRAVAQLRARLALPSRARIEAVVRRIGPASRASNILLERLLLAASPSLALSPALLRELVWAYAAHLATPVPVAAPAVAKPPSIASREEASVARGGTLAPLPESGIGPNPSPAASGTSQDALAETPVRQAAGPPQEQAEPLLLEDRESAAAGLWLVIPSLIRMGFREWLAERPAALCDDPGRTLLRTVARHHRVSGRDPAFLPLALPEEEDGRPPPDWALLWRYGLDRWLRRGAKMPLHALVRRRGWIRMSEDRLIVRFRPDAVDMRLRRRALDVDPGWTDWLGLVVRYLYAERSAR
jgi:hypothetical protein